MASQLFAGLIFGGIGLVAFMYGKKQARLNLMLLGAALMAYPYLVPDPVWVWVVGAGLTAAAWFLRE